MAAQQKKDNDWFAWVLIVFLFAVGLAPLALLLLFFKLFGGDGQKKQASPPPLQTRSQTAEQAAPRQPSKAREAVEKVTKTPQAKKSTAFWLKLIKPRQKSLYDRFLILQTAVIDLFE